MWPKLAALFLLTSAYALADGAPKTPFGGTILPADTQTWHCQSGRTVVSFSPNTQSVRLFYRQQVHVLMLLPATPSETAVGTLRYSEIGLPGDHTFGQPRTGQGLEWTANVQKPNSVGLFQVTQHNDGQRRRVRLDACWRG